jgi:hypothetical protein
MTLYLCNVNPKAHAEGKPDSETVLYVESYPYDTDSEKEAANARASSLWLEAVQHGTVGGWEAYASTDGPFAWPVEAVK